MSGFQVSTASLISASALIGTSACAGGRAGLGGASGAAAQTPAAGAWAGFAERADGALVDTDEVTGDLARALLAAARAYQLSDEATTAAILG